jgi:hypothetical protein
MVISIITVIVAIAGLVFVAKQIQIALAEFKLNRIQSEKNEKWQKSLISHDYIKRYNHHDFMATMAVAIDYFKRDDKNRKERVEELLSDAKLRSAIIVSMNYFEEMGIMFNNDLLDRELIRRFFRRISKSYYTSAVSYIENRRQINNNVGIYTNWEAMNNNPDFDKVGVQ